MKILVLSPNQITRWNPGHQHFRNAIGLFNDCKYYGPGYGVFERLNKLNYVPDILQYYHVQYSWVPDIIVTYGYKYTLPFEGLNHPSRYQKIPKVHFICDFTPAIKGWNGTIKEYLSMMRRDNYDLYFALSYQVMDWFERNWSDKKIFFLPFGVNEDIFKKIKTPKENNVYIGWSNHEAIYPLRRPLEKAFSEQFEKVKIRRFYNQLFVSEMNSSHIVLNTSNAFNTMNMKTFEVMACGSLLLTEWTKELNHLGFRHGIHYVSYKTVNEAISHAKLLLENKTIMNEIATRGYNLTLEKHTNNHRVKRMMRILNENL